MAPTNEELIKRGIIGQLVWDDNVNANKIHVEVSKGNVSLSGNVNTYSEKIAAYKDASRVLGVKKIENKLQVTDDDEIFLYPEEERKVYQLMKKLLQK